MPEVWIATGGHALMEGSTKSELLQEAYEDFKNSEPDSDHTLRSFVDDMKLWGVEPVEVCEGYWRLVFPALWPGNDY